MKLILPKNADSGSSAYTEAKASGALATTKGLLKAIANRQQAWRKGTETEHLDMERRSEFGADLNPAAREAIYNDDEGAARLFITAAEERRDIETLNDIAFCAIYKRADKTFAATVAALQRLRQCEGAANVDVTAIIELHLNLMETAFLLYNTDAVDALIKDADSADLLAAWFKLFGPKYPRSLACASRLLNKMEAVEPGCFKRLFKSDTFDFLSNGIPLASDVTALLALLARKAGLAFIPESQKVNFPILEGEFHRLQTEFARWEKNSGDLPDYAIIRPRQGRMQACETYPLVPLGDDYKTLVRFFQVQTGFASNQVSVAAYVGLLLFGSAQNYLRFVEKWSQDYEHLQVCCFTNPSRPFVNGILEGIMGGASHNKNPAFWRRWGDVAMAYGPGLLATGLQDPMEPDNKYYPICPDESVLKICEAVVNAQAEKEALRVSSRPWLKSAKL